MTVIARDLFLGDADVDINGRVPDGGEEPSTAVGAWLKDAGNVLTLDIVPPQGLKSSLGTSGPVAYLSGLTLGVDYTVRATVQFTGANATRTAAIIAHGNTPLTGGYILALSQGGVTGQLNLNLYYSLGSFDVLATKNTVIEGTDPARQQPHVIELQVSGTHLFALLDGVAILTAALDPATFPVFTGGHPGLYIVNGTSPERGTIISRFEVETLNADGSGGTGVDAPLPCQQTFASAVYSQDRFTGPDEPSLEGRIPDGGENGECLSQGAWHNVAVVKNEPVIPQHVEISNETAVHKYSVHDYWNHEALEGMETLGNDYTVEVEAVFATPTDLAWVSALARQQLGGAQTVPFTAGTTAWVCPQGVTTVVVKCWQGGYAGGGATGNPAAGGGGGGGTYVQKTLTVVPGTEYTVVVGASQAGTAGNGGGGNASRFQLAGVDLALATGTGGGGIAATVNSTNGAGGVPNTTGSIGDIITQGGSGSAGNFTSGVAGGQGGQGGEGGIGGAARPDSTAGQSGALPGGGGSGGKANSATDRNGGAGAAGSITLTYGYGAHANESGYEFNLQNSGLVTLWFYTNGSYATIQNGQYSVSAGTTYRLKLCIKGNQMCCSINDEPIIFATHNTYTEGQPGFCMLDGGGLGTLVTVTRWRVSGNEVNAPLCGGDGGGHGEPGAGSGDAIVWPMRVGAWREVAAPVGTASDLISRYGKGAPRAATALWVMQNGAWREVTGTSSDPSDGGLWNGDPGDAIPDPGCGQVPTPDVPSVPLAPLDDKLFFCYNLPLEGATDPFDTAVWAMGTWMPDYLAIAQARGMRLIGGVGGYSRFFTGGSYDPAKMDAVIEGHAPFMDTIANYADLGIFYGQLVIDDYHSAERWGEVISLEEVDRIAAKWKSEYPWIRTVLRDTPSNVNGYGSNTLPHVDTFLTQYVVRYGDVNDWIANQISLATGHFGGAAILWSLNFKHPRGMTSPPMTVADIVEFGTPMAETAYSHGMGGWEYSLPFLNQAGMVNALSTLRNTMAGVP